MLLIWCTCGYKKNENFYKKTRKNWNFHFQRKRMKILAQRKSRKSRGHSMLKGPGDLFVWMDVSVVASLFSSFFSISF
jgi:hypothetical protein